MAGPSAATDDLSPRAFTRRLNRVYGFYVLGLLLFIAALAGLEAMGMSRRWIGAIFLLSTVLLYAGIGVLCRTSDADEYYVAGRRVPSAYNGMATAADWMSAASFLSMAGIIAFMGYDGSVYLMGWTGGYVLLALLLAPVAASAQRPIEQVVPAAPRVGGQQDPVGAIVRLVERTLRLGRAQVDGPADSILPLVDRLSVALLR